MKGVLFALLTCVACSKHEGKFQLQARPPSSGPGFELALEETVGETIRPGQSLSVIFNGAVFDQLSKDIAKAERSVDIELYIWRDGAASDGILHFIGARTEKGVKCRVLLDALGSIDLGDTLRGKMAAAHCELRVFRPLKGSDKEHRNHRKLAIIDGRVGFAGGWGMDDKWLGDGLDKNNWRDTNVRVTGSIAGEMQQTFAEDWQEAGGEMIPAEAFPAPDESGPARGTLVTSQASPVVTNAEKLSLLAIASAHKRLWIENAYFVPSQQILDLLEDRAKAGVDVRVLTAGRKSDSKFAFLYAQTDYGELQKRGVKVWEYQASMMHAKTILVDDELVVIGSINFDPLSLNELDESAVVAEDPAANRALAAAFERDAQHSKFQQ